MNKYVEAWIKDLEETDAPQTTRNLNHIGVGQCCLGRLGDVMIDMGVDISRSQDGTNIRYNRRVSMLPDEIFALTDLTRADQITFTDWNDHQGLTFKEIAARLRERFS